MWSKCFGREDTNCCEGSRSEGKSAKWSYAKMEWLRNTDGSKVPGLGIALLFFTNYLLLMKPKRMRSLFKRAQHSLLGLKKNLNVLFSNFCDLWNPKECCILLPPFEKNTHSFKRTHILLKRASILLKKTCVLLKWTRVLFKRMCLL